VQTREICSYGGVQYRYIHKFGYTEALFSTERHGSPEPTDRSKTTQKLAKISHPMCLKTAQLGEKTAELATLYE